MENARQAAYSLLLKCECSGQYSNIAIDHALSESRMKDIDKALTSALFYGVIERRITLDYYISKLSSRPLCKIDRETLTAARMGIYQLEFMDKIPPHAAVNETVGLVKHSSKGFVNALLRSYMRLEEPIALPDKDDITKYLSVAYSVNESLAARLVSDLGAEGAEEYLAATLRTPLTTLRVNTLKVTREELASHIDGATPTSLSPAGLYAGGAVREMHGFSDGLFFVQDEASQICVGALGAKQGERVLDVCSCPGSKSFGLAIEMENRGEILAFDLHKNKLSLVLSGAERLGIDIIKAEAHDAREPIEELFESADRVLCDVPCSGFGVIAKKPELRYKDPVESERLPEIQLAILENCSRYLKRGGTLVYSTCTVLSEENENNVRRFLDNDPDFELCPFEYGGFVCESGMATLLPNTHGTDGFFVAKLIRK